MKVLKPTYALILHCGGIKGSAWIAWEGPHDNLDVYDIHETGEHLVYDKREK